MDEEVGPERIGGVLFCWVCSRSQTNENMCVLSVSFFA